MKKKGFNNLYALGEKLSIDLSLSENPLGFSNLVSQELSAGLTKLNDYPDVKLSGLTSALAKKFGLGQVNFFIGNGSESVLLSVTKNLLEKGDQVIIPELTFPMFAIASELEGAEVLRSKMDENLGISLEEIKKLVGGKTRIVFLCNPNNPTGGVIPKANLLEFLAKLPDSVFVVIDEANIEFGGQSVIKEVKNFKNLIVLRTFSKGFGLASLRIGFCAANSEIIELLQQNTQPFPISGISEKLAIAALKDGDFLKKTKQFVQKQRRKMRTAIGEIGFKVFPTQSINLFVKIPDEFDASLFGEKLKLAGISVINGSNFPGFDDRFFRVSPRDESTNQLFLEKLAQISDELSEGQSN